MIVEIANLGVIGIDERLTFLRQDAAFSTFDALAINDLSDVRGWEQIPISVHGHVWGVCIHVVEKQEEPAIASRSKPAQCQIVDF